MELILQNTSNQELSYLSGSHVVPANGELLIAEAYYLSLHNDPTVRHDIRLRTLILCDGLVDYAEGAAETFLEKLAYMPQADSENAPLLRLKYAPSKWIYSARSIEVETSVLGSVVDMKPDGTNYTHSVIRFYDSSDVELLTQAQLDVSCVQTIVDFEPPYDYEVVGGSAQCLNAVNVDLRIWVIAVPDLTLAQGGSRLMVDGINFKYLGANDKVVVDGRASKRLNYSASLHTNKLRIILRHPAGHKSKLQVVIDHFKA